MTRALASTLAVLLAAPVAVTASIPAAAQAHAPKPAAASKPLAQALTGQAKADYEAGRTLFGDGDYPGALIKFQSAYDASKDPRLLYNVAYCEKNLRHYAKVIATLRRYLAEGDGYLTDKDRKDAQDLITTIQPFTTNATIHVNQDGAQVFVDDEPVGTTPLSGPVVLDIGERKVRVTKDGFEPFEKTIPVGGSATVNLDVALQPEVHQGRLVVNAPADATLTLDDKPVGTGGKVDMSVAAGGHQLRATAPGMRPYQTEVVVNDKETRQLDVVLEKELAPEKPRLRVAIGCDGPEPKGPDDGLVVYLDGPDVLPPAGVKKHWDDHEQRNVVDYVEYAVDPGKHTIRARIPDCDAMDATVQVDPQTGGSVTGALETDTPLLFQGPQGSPGHWRIGPGLWMFSMTQRFKSNMPEYYEGSSIAAATGLSIEGAIVWRWFGVFLSFADGYGSMRRSTFTTNDALPSTSSLQVLDANVRASFRIPFNVVSWNVIGPSLGIANIRLQDLSSDMHPAIGGWTGFDVQPFCDWGASLSGQVQVIPSNPDAVPGLTLQAGLFWEPNSHCRRERATQFGLRAGEVPR